MRRPLAVALLLTALLPAGGCSTTKGQHEQAVEWQQYYGDTAVQLQRDLHTVQAARVQYQQQPSDDNLRVLVTFAGTVQQDITDQPSGIGQRSGPGAVGDAVQGLLGIEARLSRTAADIDAGDFAAAVQDWNQAVDTIWKAGSGDPAPTV